MKRFNEFVWTTLWMFKHRKEKNNRQKNRRFEKALANRQYAMLVKKCQKLVKKGKAKNLAEAMISFNIVVDTASMHPSMWHHSEM